MVKTITISDKAYEFLKMLKGENKSFSEIIISVKKGKQEIMSYAGSLKSADLRSVKQIREELRKDWNKR